MSTLVLAAAAPAANPTALALSIAVVGIALAAASASARRTRTTPPTVTPEPVPSPSDEVPSALHVVASAMVAARGIPARVRYWRGSLGRVSTYRYTLADGRAVVARVLPLVPSTPTTRARAAELREAMRCAADTVPTTWCKLADALDRRTAAQEVGRAFVRRVRSPLALAAAFGLDVRAVDCRLEDGRPVALGRLFSPMGAYLGEVERDAPSLVVPFDVTHDDLCDAVAWACGALALEWIGDDVPHRDTDYVASAFGRAITIPRGATEPLWAIECAWDHQVDEHGDCTDEDGKRWMARMLEEAEGIARGLGAASASMVVEHFLNRGREVSTEVV